MHEPPVAFVSHKTGSRIRIKVPSKRNDFSFFSLLEKKMPAIRGIQSVETNPLTASVLILHSSDPEHILQLSTREGLFSFGKSAFTGTALQGRISETFKGIDLALKDVSGNELDLGGAAFLTLLGLGIYQIARGNVTAVPWYAAGWYALNIFLKSMPGKEPA